MHNDPNAHLGHAEDSSRFSDGAVLEVPKVDGLARFGAETFDRVEQHPTLIALLYLFGWIKGDEARDGETRASCPVAMVVSGEVRDGAVEPAAKLGFGRGCVRRGPYPRERFLDDFLGDVIVQDQHVCIPERRMGERADQGLEPRAVAIHPSPPRTGLGRRPGGVRHLDQDQLAERRSVNLDEIAA